MSTIKKIFNSLIWCFNDINEHNAAYKIVAFLGILVRVVALPYLIPDVFEVIANLIVNQLYLPQWFYEISIRLILLAVDALALSRIFYQVSYLSVGNSYERYSEPWWGSLCYTVYYTMYMAIPILIINFFELWWAIALVFGGYAIISAGIYLLSGLVFYSLPDNWILRLILHIFAFAIVVTFVFLLWFGL